jgi:Protein of unknown function (DUF3667)
MLTESSKNCINCHQEVSEQYCSHCGQRILVKRITLREGWNDFWARIYGFDGMFPNTLRDLTLRPGIATRTFIAGNRVKYYGPVGYFFLMITLFLLLLDMLNIELADFLKEMGSNTFQPEIKSGSRQEAVTQKMFQFMSDNFKLLFFGMIPIQAFYARYVFFRKSELNYVENMVLPLYTAGHIYWISIMTIIVYKFSGVFMRNTIGTIISTIYIGFSYANLFSYQPKWKAFLKGLVAYYLSLLTFIIIGMVILVGLIVLFPSIREVFAPK